MTSYLSSVPSPIEAVDEVLAMDTGLYAHLVDIVSEGIYVVDRQRRIAFWNGAAESITGYRAEDVVGKRCADGILRHCNAEGQIMCGTSCPLAGTMDDGRDRTVDAYFLHHDGQRVPVRVRSSVVRDSSGSVVGCAELFHDTVPISAMRDELLAAKQHARMDTLTGLGNRRLLEEKLTVLGGRRATDVHSTAIIFFDIDRFKSINDKYGHRTGDRVIAGVASTAAAVVRSFDIVGRWGGEEFVIIAPGLDARDAAARAERMRALVGAMRIPVGDGELQVTISLGVTVVGNESGHVALERADRLMYASKESGRNRVTAG